MNSFLRRARWSPYAVGAGIGVLSWATFFFMNKALGTSTTMVNAACGIECLVAPGHAESNAYLSSTVTKSGAIIDWQFALVVMLAVGALVAALLGRSYEKETVPTLWASRFGPSKLKRYAFAFLGGVILIFGARLAGGCTSGHAISGGLQLAVSSWTFLVAMFISGVATAFALFGKEGRRHV